MKKTLLAILLCGLITVSAAAFTSCGDNGDPATDETTAGEETTAEETTAAETAKREIVGIEVATPPTKTEYAAGEAFDATGMVVNVVYDDGSTEPTEKYRVRTTGGLGVSDTVVELSYSTYRTEVPVTVVIDLSGTGTKEDPYIIETPSNFSSFVSMLKSGETFKDMYLKQTADLDLTSVEALVNADQTFAGYYDGCGYTIHVDSTEKDSCICIFPTVTGVVANVGTTGKMSPGSGTQAAGVVRKVGDKGIVFNVWSSVVIDSGSHTSGIAYHNCGKIVGCIYLGKLSGSTWQYTTSSPTASSSYGTQELAYYTNDCQVSAKSGNLRSDSTEIKKDDIAATLETINAALEEKAKELGIDDKISIVKWTADRIS